MLQEENTKKKKWSFRWHIPLLITILCLIWEVVAIGFDMRSVVKGYFAFLGIGIFYNWLMSWFKEKAGKKPRAIELFLALPFFAVILFATVPPFPYVRPWLLTAGLIFIGYEIWAFSLGYLFQEKGLQKTCTAHATAVVIDNVKERVRTRPGKISPLTYYPVLAYDVQGERIERPYDHGQPRPMEVQRRIDVCYNPKKPEEFCFLEQKENKTLTVGVAFFLIMGTAVLIAAVLSVRYQWSF